MKCDSGLNVLDSKIPPYVSVYCNFDSKSLCGFTQDSSDQFDWALNKGPTGSTPSTGPTADFSGNGKITH